MILLFHKMYALKAPVYSQNRQTVLRLSLNSNELVLYTVPPIPHIHFHGTHRDTFTYELY